MNKKNENLSRRNFVRNSSMASGGIILAPSILSASPFYKKEKVLKLAVVGCGGRGTGAVSQALRADDNVKLVAMADAFQDQLDGSFDNLSKIFTGSNLIS